MSVSAEIQCRRDPRFRLRPGYASLTITAAATGAGAIEAAVTEFSAAGIGFELDRTTTGIEAGGVFRSITIHVGSCPLHGDILIKNIRDNGGAQVAVGALFYPHSDADENRLAGLIAGLRAGL